MQDILLPAKFQGKLDSKIYRVHLPDASRKESGGVIWPFSFSENLVCHTLQLLLPDGRPLLGVLRRKAASRRAIRTKANGVACLAVADGSKMNCGLVLLAFKAKHLCGS